MTVVGVGCQPFKDAQVEYSELYSVYRIIGLFINPQFSSCFLKPNDSTFHMDLDLYLPNLDPVVSNPDPQN